MSLCERFNQHNGSSSIVVLNQGITQHEYNVLRYIGGRNMLKNVFVRCVMDSKCEFLQIKLIVKMIKTSTTPSCNGNNRLNISVTL